MAVLEKRTYDSRIFDIDCTDLLDTAETISSVATVTADQGGLSFGVPATNGAAVTYPDGRTAAIGKVIQVAISGGEIPAGLGELECTIRARFATSINPQLEATAVLRLTDSVEG